MGGLYVLSVKNVFASVTMPDLSGYAPYCYLGNCYTDYVAFDPLASNSLTGDFVWFYNSTAKYDGYNGNVTVGYLPIQAVSNVNDSYGLNYNGSFVNGQQFSLCDLNSNVCLTDNGNNSSWNTGLVNPNKVIYSTRDMILPNGTIEFIANKSGINPKTRIITFTPEDGTTTLSAVPVDFNLHAYINADDLGTFAGIKITYHNIDQNVLLASDFSTSDIVFLDRIQATSSGDFYYATSTLLADGDYRVTAELEKTTIFGIINPFAGTLGTIDEQSHQFIVGSETFIGHISQSNQKELAQFYASSTATTSSALASTCNPLGAFDIRSCLSFLFVPDSNALNDSLNTLKNGVLNRAPWGYITRIINIMATTSITTLPVLSYTFQGDSPLAGDTLSYDTGAYLTASAQISNEAVSNMPDHKTVWEILKTPISLFIYLVLVLGMLKDITGIPFIHHKK